MREGLLGIALVPVVFLAVAIVLGVVLTFVPRLHNVPLNPLEAMVQTPRDAIIFSIVVMIAGGVREEVQRGFIVHRFDQYLGGACFGVAAYSVAFGLGHLEQGGTRRWRPGCSARSGAASTSSGAASSRRW